MNVGVIGAGAWGTALAVLSARGGNDCALFFHDRALAENASKGRENPLLPGVEIPANVLCSAEIRLISDSDVWLIASPSGFFRRNLQKSRDFWRNRPIIVCTKGVEADTGKFMSEIIAEEMPEVQKSGLVGILSGPQFAGEVARGLPAGSTLAGRADVFAVSKRAIPGIFLENTGDIIGAELCGAGKNAVALLAGFLTGRGAGENEKALNITLAWNEIAGLGRRMGAESGTFMMLCGLGDLLLSATSATSRNFSAGHAIGRGQMPGRDATAEGISALRGLLMRAEMLGLSMPVLGDLHRRASFFA
jgi:glycerol-3-phosphate dehydrogenase (NAD(P)+)